MIRKLFTPSPPSPCTSKTIIFEENIFYLDSNKPYCAYQFISFFNSGFLDKKNTLVLFRRYVESVNDIAKTLSSNNISFKTFKKWGELPYLNGKNIYYSFNSMSNQRIVDNRENTHIFIQHGESPKAASYKSSYRLYDYIVAPGIFSMNRFLRHKIFTQHDFNSGRVIFLGDTFVQSIDGLKYSKDSQSLLLSFTWEGGIPSENYTTLGSKNLQSLLLNIIESNGISSILVKTHPNTGSRNTIYYDYLVKLIENILKRNISVSILDSSRYSFIKKLKKRLSKKVNFINDFNHSVLLALTDISGMESVLLKKKIPTLVLYESKYSTENKESSHYINLTKNITPPIYTNIHENYIEKLFYYHSERVKNYSYKDRRVWLESFIEKNNYWDTPHIKEGDFYHEQIDQVV